MKRWSSLKPGKMYVATQHMIVIPYVPLDSEKEVYSEVVTSSSPPMMFLEEIAIRTNFQDRWNLTDMRFKLLLSDGRVVWTRAWQLLKEVKK